MALCPGQASFDMTPDIIALLDTVQTPAEGCETGRNLFEPATSCGEVPTLVQFT